MGLIVEQNLSFAAPQRPLPADTAELAALAGHLRAGRCALFVGAGLSAPAGLPKWGELIERLVHASTPWAVPAEVFPRAFTLNDPPRRALRDAPVDAIRAALGPKSFAALCARIQRVRKQRSFDLQVLNHALHVIHADTSDRAELERLARDKRFAELAGYCRDRFGRAHFHDLVRKLLTAPGGPPATHADIVRAPYSCVVTTNFDTLLEDAYALHGRRGVPRAPTGAELSQQGTLLLDRGFFVLKAHGDAARPETMIFTADDYRRVIHANPAFQSIVSGILLSNAVLFVGYSLSDTNFRLLLDNQLTIFNGNVPPRYALLAGVDDAECDILWETAKLRVLPYPAGQHGEVARFLAGLADQVQTQGTSRARTRPTALEIRPARKAPPELVCTLFIEGEGDQLALELVARRVGQPSQRLAIGAAQRPDTRRHGHALRAADQASARGQSPLPEIRGLGSRLARSLTAPLARALRALPRRTLLELAPSARLTRVPWEWTLVEGEPLCVRHAVVRRPTEVTHEARGHRAVNRPLRALVLGDAGSGDGLGLQPLYFADLEARAIEQLLRASAPGTLVTRLERESATHARLVHELEQGDYDLIHFGGHAWFDAREAYFHLWDRVMLGSELAPLLTRRPPALMVLDTHYTAFVLAEADATARELVGSPSDPKPSPAELNPRGFAEAAMRCGVSSFVGAFGNVVDQGAAELMVALYAELLQGVTAAEALRRARVRTKRSALDAGLVYTLYGYPQFRLLEPNQRRANSLSAPRQIARAKARCRWPGSERGQSARVKRRG